MKKSISILMLIALTGTLALSIASCTQDIDIVSSEVISNSIVTTEVSSEETSSFADTRSYDEAKSRAHSESLAASRAVVSALSYGEGPVEPSMPDELPVYKEGSIKLAPHDEPYAGPVNRKYRNVFYTQPCDQWDLELFEIRAGRELKGNERNPFFGWIVENDSDSTQEREEMYIVTIIKAFNVTREEMEILLEIRREEDSFDEDFFNTHEMSEFPNLDIIYTLDNDIINEYYRYA